MRHRAQARHARYCSRRPVRAFALTGLAAVLTISAGIGVTASGSSAAEVRPAYTALDDRAYDLPAADQTSRDGFHATELASLAAAGARQAHTAQLAALPRYAVRAGDSISAVAQARCRAARDWTGIYGASRELGLTARNANTLTKGQHLAIQCAYDASQLRFAPAPPPPPRIVTAAAVTSNRPQGSVGARAVRSNTASSYAGSGVYSYAGLERLWVSAGGPSWAEAHAAEIAECESGGRVSAYNPSGATGLWQILGSVVRGSLYNPYVNALNAVSKFRASGDTFAQWVCQ